MMHTQDTIETPYETHPTHSSDEDYLMMSRMNWMTYLKVLFDKLTQNQYSLNVDVLNLLESLQQIKQLLPLQYKQEYTCKHGQERGFTVQDVERSLKRFMMVNKNA